MANGPDFTFKPSLDIVGLASLLSQKAEREQQMRLADEQNKRQRFATLLQAVELGSNLATQGLQRSALKQEIQAKRGIGDAIDQLANVEARSVQPVTRLEPRQVQEIGPAFVPRRTIFGETPEGQEILGRQRAQAERNLLSAFARVAPEAAVNRLFPSESALADAELKRIQAQRMLEISQEKADREARKESREIEKFKQGQQETEEIESGRRNAQIRKANIIIRGIDDLLPRSNIFTAGFFGAPSKFIPGTPSANFAADLQTIEANIAFDALQEMRELSKTGGALGQVAIKELELLRDVRGALLQSQSPAQLKRNLNKIKESFNRVRAAAMKEEFDVLKSRGFSKKEIFQIMQEKGF